jgi:hypothetical protein
MEMEMQKQAVKPGSYVMNATYFEKEKLCNECYIF